MSFQSDYYKPLCDYLLELLKPINSSKYTFDQEILRRDFVSRSYYTALLHCKNLVEEDIDKNILGTHAQVINATNDEISIDLRKLKSLRVMADYDTNTFPMPLKTKKEIVHLERIQAIVNNIISKDYDNIT